MSKGASNKPNSRVKPWCLEGLLEGQYPLILVTSRDTAGTHRTTAPPSCVPVLH